MSLLASASAKKAEPEISKLFRPDFIKGISLDEVKVAQSLLSDMTELVRHVSSRNFQTANCGGSSVRDRLSNAVAKFSASDPAELRDVLTKGKTGPVGFAMVQLAYQLSIQVEFNRYDSTIRDDRQLTDKQVQEANYAVRVALKVAAPLLDLIQDYSIFTEVFSPKLRSAATLSSTLHQISEFTLDDSANLALAKNLAAVAQKLSHQVQWNREGTSHVTWDEGRNNSHWELSETRNNADFAEIMNLLGDFARRFNMPLNANSRDSSRNLATEKPRIEDSKTWRELQYMAKYFSKYPNN